MAQRRNGGLLTTIQNAKKKKQAKLAKKSTYAPLHLILKSEPKKYEKTLKAYDECQTVSTSQDSTKIYYPKDCNTPGCPCCDGGYSKTLKHQSYKSYEEYLLGLKKAPDGPVEKAHYYSVVNFNGIPVSEIITFTLDLSIDPLSVTIQEAQESGRDQLDKFFKSRLANASVLAFLEIKYNPANMFHDGHLGHRRWVKELNEPDEWVFMTHVHGIMHVPNMHHDQITKEFRSVFTGTSQFHSSSPSDPVFKPGFRKGGVPGWIDYCTQGIKKEAKREDLSDEVWNHIANNLPRFKYCHTKFMRKNRSSKLDVCDASEITLITETGNSDIVDSDNIEGILSSDVTSIHKSNSFKGMPFLKVMEVMSIHRDYLMRIKEFRLHNCPLKKAQSFDRFEVQNHISSVNLRNRIMRQAP